MENCSSTDFFFVDTSQFSPLGDQATENDAPWDASEEAHGCVDSFDDQVYGSADDSSPTRCNTTEHDVSCEGVSEKAQGCVEPFDDRICGSGDDSSPSRRNGTEGDASWGASEEVLDCVESLAERACGSGNDSSPFRRNATEGDASSESPTFPRFKWTEARKTVLVKLFLELKDLPKGQRLEALLSRFKSTEEGQPCSLKAASLEKMSLRILKKQVDPVLDSSIDKMLVSLSECALKVYSMQSDFTFIHVLSDLFKIHGLEASEKRILQRYRRLRKRGQIDALPLPEQNGGTSLARVRRWRAQQENREKERQRDALRKRESRGKGQAEAAPSDSPERMLSPNDEHAIPSTSIDFFAEGNQFKQEEAAPELHIAVQCLNGQICIGGGDTAPSQINTTENHPPSGNFSAFSSSSEHDLCDLLIPHRIMHVDSETLTRVRRWRAHRGNRERERQRDAQAKREKRRKIQMFAALSEYHKARAAERMRRWRASQNNRERERERDALKKREKRKDPDFRERERVWSRLAKREKRKDDCYRQLEREKNKLAMREKRKDESFRQKERERNKLAQREKRAKQKIDNYLYTGLLKQEDVPAPEYIREINLGQQMGNYNADLLFFKEEPMDELTVDLKPSIEYVEEGNGLGVYIKQENSEAGCARDSLELHKRTATDSQV